MNKTKKLTLCAVLTATALLLFIVEMQIPSFVAIPGIKIGLANIITLLAIRLSDKKSAAMILTCRIILGSIFAGQAVYFLYSISGGVLCYITMCLFDKLLSDKQVWALSILGALAHNIGQLCVAAVIMQSSKVFLYLPYLLISAVCSGLFTGICAQFIIIRYNKTKKKGGV